MKQKHFYTHLIEIDSVFTVLELLEMNPQERQELMLIVESTIHHVVVETVLSELSEEDKKIFLKHMAQDNHDEIWVLLNTKVKHPDAKILKAVEKLKHDFHKDMKKVMKK